MIFSAYSNSHIFFLSKNLSFWLIFPAFSNSISYHNFSFLFLNQRIRDISRIFEFGEELTANHKTAFPNASSERFKESPKTSKVTRASLLTNTIQKAGKQPENSRKEMKAGENRVFFLSLRLFVEKTETYLEIYRTLTHKHSSLHARTYAHTLTKH